MSVDTRLDLYIGQVYHAKEPALRAFAEQAFRELIASDHTFRTEAQARLASIQPAMLKRDHVSRETHDILTKVLANG